MVDTSLSQLPRGHLFRGLLRPALASSVLFMLVTGLAYPLATTAIAQVLFPSQARGSLVERDGALIGSAIIGQDFQQPTYFHPRPSATTAPDPADSTKSVDQPYNAALSAASNLGPTSKKLLDAVAARALAYRKENGLGADTQVPVDAVTASASGLDPDISLANARLQIGRVARTRGLPEQQLQVLVERETTPRQLGLLGEPRVNVLQLNLALDAATVHRAAAP
jgi:K+-transporting ATPase ATPase C chain